MTNHKEQMLKRGLWQSLHRLIKPDWMFGFMTLIGLGLTVASFVDPEQTKLASVGLWTRLGAMIPLLLILSYCATLLAGLDRRWTEEYHFQLMANGAVIGVITAVFANMIWLLFVDTLGTLTPNNLIGMIMIGWGLGYFFYRIRGLSK
ncbi:hypothetical protein [Parasphingorhabdus cellanae]|uniref:Uncharacterized protein n=1 Tax=Parasphingorhabdus cellanae TaxID=2806553 RepID=A0ABX7T8Q3_9SPHN|nr:hypothetical protein [Parasphingorhabdus cellanae]QTD57157.1 hypothetical protein J4G78_06310 [Parasphingorhabdus cellanae]